MSTSLPPHAGPVPTNGKAVASAVCGIAAWIFCPVVAAVAALILARAARREIVASGGGQGGEGLATAGRILALLHLGLVLLGVLGAVVYLLTGSAG